MKPLTLLCVFLIAYGIFVYGFLAVQRARVAVSGPLIPFDEDGERVFAPAVGTIALAGGVFLLVLSSARGGREVI